MTEASKRIDDALLELAWSLWTELGVAGTVRHHEDCAVDPEALLVFTSALATLDPRLRDESLDCALTVAPYLSMGRLKGMVAHADDAARSQFAAYAATFNAHSKSHVRFPAAESARPWELRRSGKAHMMGFSRPSQIVLRCRAIFGVGARADVLAIMLSSSREGWFAAEVAERTGIAKRVVASALQDFERGGVLGWTAIGNRLRYDFADCAGAASFVGALPTRNPAWASLLPFCASVRRLMASEARRSEVAVLVDAQRLVTDFIAALARIGVRTAPPSFATWSETSAWLLEHLEGLAQGQGSWLG